MTYRVYTVSTATWADKIEVKPSSCSWSRAMNEGKGGNAAFVLSDPDVAETVSGGALNPIERCLVVEFAGVVVYAGIIWETDYDHDSQTLTATHDDIWSLWDLRLIASDRSSSTPKWKQTYSKLEYDTIIKRLVQLGTAGVGRIVPMVYEDDYSGGRERTYYGYNVDTVLDAITEIMDLTDGPDVDFRPEWDNGGTSIRWTLRTGYMNPDGHVVEVNFAADQSPARGLKMKTSGNERATQILGVGEGSGVDMLVRPAGNSGTFALERAEQSKNIKDGSQLSGFAQGELSTRSALIRQYSFDVPLDSPVVGSLWTLKPGMTLRWYISGDPFITSGWRNSTVLQYAGDISSDWVHLEAQ